jgi:copper(I)-binding protein
MHKFTFASGALAIAIALSAGPALAGGIAVTGGWIRALPANVPSGGYFNLSNDTGKRIVLTGASSPACGMLMLHKSDMSDGMSSMSDVESIAIAVGAHVTFAPGGYHLMCMDPTPAIKPGSKVPVTLVFEDGARVTNTFVVRDAAGH